MIKNIFLILFICFLVSLIFTQEATNQPKTESEETIEIQQEKSEDDIEPSLDDSFDQDKEIDEILSKYDPNKDGYYTKENYKNLLSELLFATEEEAAPDLNEGEKLLIKEILAHYVDKKKKEKFSYKEVIEELESQEFLNVIATEMEEFANKMNSETNAQIEKDKNRNNKNKVKKEGGKKSDNEVAKKAKKEEEKAKKKEKKAMKQEKKARKEAIKKLKEEEENIREKKEQIIEENIELEQQEIKENKKYSSIHEKKVKKQKNDKKNKKQKKKTKKSSSCGNANEDPNGFCPLPNLPETTNIQPPEKNEDETKSEL